MEVQEYPEIIAFVELDTAGNLGQINQGLKDRLPTYAIPNKIETVQRIPRTENGKVDRQYLKRTYLKSKQNPELSPKTS
jgi:acyl-coenzyme A synthetase/AMP-(fatty) acid ligase